MPLNNIQSVGELPDSMEPDELLPIFGQILDWSEFDATLSAEEIADAFWELADRQWHTYERLETSVASRVEQWIIRAWPANSHSAEFVTSVLGIVQRLGLCQALTMIKDSSDGRLDPEINLRVQRALNEFGDSVDDPWKSLRGKDSDSST